MLAKNRGLILKVFARIREFVFVYPAWFDVLGVAL